MWQILSLTGDQIIYDLQKKTKRGRRKLISHLELFQQVQFVNFYIYMISRLQKPRKQLQGFKR